MEDLKVETSYGHCRCCLEEGNHRDITRVYQQNGLQEVYADIFLDCFNVFISSNMNLSSLICYSCVEQLRSARDFKSQVLRTEEHLMDALQGCDNEQMVLVNVPVANDTLNTTVGFKIQVHDFEAQKPKPEPEPAPVTAKTEPEVAAPEEGHSTDSEYNYILQSSPKKEQIKKRDPKKQEKLALMSNTITLLENCNATLFKSRMRSGFPCFFCREIFDNFNVLRQHQMDEHPRNALSKVLKKYSAESMVVYADVTDLECIVCDRSMPSLKDLKEHLVKTHKMSFYSKVTDRVVPFKLNENYFECQICAFNFETFGAIERHMNTHFRNYVCNVCGGGFVTMLRLKTHLYALHNEGTFPCEYCDKVFSTQLRYKVHVDFVHKMLKKLKCQKCSERFSDYFVQKKHMVEVHGESPVVYRCNVCSKGFNRRYTLSCHMKRHLDQKDVECNLCTYTCYNKTELKEHMLKHNKQNTDRMFKCNVCEKSYSRKKTLREHMRIHTDERRYVCPACDHTFVQSHSLKTHLRNQHKVYVNDLVI